MSTRQIVTDFLLKHTDRTPEQIEAWLSKPNKCLGDVSPGHFIELGRGDFLMRYLKYQVYLNTDQPLDTLEYS